MALTTSIEEKSKDKFLKCSCWARLTDKLKARLKSSTPTFMTRKMKAIKIVPDGDDPYAGFKGFQYNIDYRG